MFYDNMGSQPDQQVSQMRKQAAKDREALYAALDLIEKIVTDPFFDGSFGEAKERLVALNAERRKGRV